MGQFHFDPETYLALIREDVPLFYRLQDEVAAATAGVDAHDLLELGTGTGETARRVLLLHPGARLTGIDASAGMLGQARLEGSELLVRRLEEPLPDGPFDFVFSALAVHHLDSPGKAELFRRVAAALRPEDALTPLTPGFDRPDRVAYILGWLADADLAARVTGAKQDLAVMAAERSV